MDPLPWFAPPPIADSTGIVIVGAGLAGCHLAWSLSKRAIPVTLIDASPTIASGASANTRCVLRPHLVRTTSQLNEFNEAAFRHAKATLCELKNAGQPVECGFPGVLQLLRQSGDWPALTTATAVDAMQASELAGTRLDSPALHFADAGWVDASSYCRALLATTAAQCINLLLNTRVRRIERRAHEGGVNSGWNIHITGAEGNGSSVLQATTVVICCGAGIKQIEQLAVLPLQLSSGQTTACSWPLGEPTPKTVLCGKRYLIPTNSEITVGATHWRDDEKTSTDPQDDTLNISALMELVPRLASTPSARPLAHANWRSLRASTPDRLPLVGGVPDLQFYREAYASLQHGAQHKRWPAAQYLEGLYVLGGLGSRGAGTASLCADLLAGQIAPTRATESPVNTHCTAGSKTRRQSWLTLLHPARFLVSQLKRAVKTHTGHGR